MIKEYKMRLSGFIFFKVSDGFKGDIMECYLQPEFDSEMLIIAFRFAFKR